MFGLIEQCPSDDCTALITTNMDTDEEDEDDITYAQIRSTLSKVATLITMNGSV